MKIYPFLTPEEQRRALKYRKIIATFLKENPGVTELNPYEKCEKVFDFVRKKQNLLLMIGVIHAMLIQFRRLKVELEFVPVVQD